MKRRQLPIVLTSIALGLLFDTLFYGQTPGFNILLFTIGVLGATYYLLRYYRRTVNAELYLAALACLFFAFMCVVRAGPLLLFFNICLILYLLLLIARLILVSPRSIRSFTARDYLRLLIVPLGLLGGLQLFFDSFSLKFNLPKHKWTPVVRGVLISLPILIIFIWLFSAADPVFRGYVTRLFNFNLSPNLVGHTADIVFFSGAFLGMYMWLFKAGLEAEAMHRREKHQLGNTEAYIILGSVAVLFLLFLLVQVTYLFGGANTVTSSGLTYAQYARNGFFELIIVAAISLVLIRSIDSRTLRRNLKETVLFIWLSGILVLEVFVIMISALKRLALYEQTYGFTFSRLFGHLFMGWLAVAFILLFIHIAREEKVRQFALQIFMTSLLFFAVLDVINPYGFIAHQNLNRYSQTGKMDILYLSSLPDDATPAIAAYLRDPNPKVQRMAIDMLAEQRLHHPDIWHHWRSFNISQNSAQKIFVDNKAALDKYPHEDELISQ